MTSYNIARTEWENATKPTTRSDTVATGATGTVGGMTELDELRLARSF